METPKTFYVLKSSAGSGKTYALVKFYLTLALKKGEVDAYKRILAITFTNAAAAEMKERIILRLRSFSEKKEKELESDDLFCEIKQELQIDAVELKRRANITLTHMLHHYGSIAVSTIDSFVHKIVRSFARDLQLAPDFNIELDSQTFYQKVADEFLSKIGRDSEITQYIQSYAIEMLEDEGSPNIRRSVEEISTELSKEETLPLLEKIASYQLEDYQKTRALLKKSILSFEESLLDKANQIFSLIDQQGLSIEDFSNKNKGILGAPFKIRKGDFIGAKDSKRFFKLEEPWFTKANAAKFDPMFSSIREEIESLRLSIIDFYEGKSFQEYRFAKASIGKIIFIGLLQKLHQIAEEIKKTENTILIADFHKIISELVAESPAPFIYERVGEKYEHILFDEFQDTSSLQWNNFLPLLENNLSKGKINLIVGDGKQAIYRWRNGKAEQFVQLPTIDSRHRPELQRALKDSYQEKLLTKNFRSASSIIDFNNRLYDLLSQNAQDEFISSVYQNQAQQKVRKEEGYVELEFFEKNKNSDEEDEEETSDTMLQRIVDIINECISGGYLYGDIAILTRRGIKDTSPITEVLFKNNISFVTKESYLVGNSVRVKLLMSLLHFLNDKSHRYSAINIWECLTTLYPQQYQLKSLFEKYNDVQAFLEAHYSEYFSLSISSTVLQIAEQLLRIFNIPKDENVEFLLDHLSRLSQQKDYGLGDAIEWWEEHREKLYVASQSDPQKVSLMTIHKSKGLQFPVVIYPRFASTSNGSKIWIEHEKSDLPVKVTMMTVKGNPQPHDSQEVLAEKRKSLLDDLNTCYVATTRPENRLYLLVHQGSGDIISKTLVDYSASFTEIAPQRFILGKKDQVYHSDLAKSDSIQLKEDTGRLVKSLTLRTTATNEHRESSQSKRLMGNILHECLSHIRMAADIPEAIQKVVPQFSGVNEYMQTKIATELLRICENPKLRPWFDKEIETLNEQEIVTTGGEPLRPDRVILKEDHWEVVDFKTGEKRTSHIHQLKKYMSELQKISEKNVKGFLIYTSDCEVIEVK